MKNQTNQVAQNKLQYKSAKNYFATLILVLGLFFSFTESGKSQCPPGYTPMVIVKTFPSGCVVTTNFCVKNLVVAGVVDVIQGTTTFNSGLLCGDIDLTEGFWDAIYDDLFKMMCTQSFFPPCPLSVAGRTVQITTKQCVRVLYIDDDPTQGVYFAACSDSYTCYKGYTVCCKPDGGIEKVVNFVYSDGFSNCTPLWSLKNSEPKFSTDPPVCYQITCR